jgi:hypothetical protein
MKTRNKNTIQNLFAVLVLTTTCGLIGFPLAAKANPIEVSDRATNEINQVVSVQASQAYNQEYNYNQTYFGIAPNGKPIVLDDNNYNNYDRNSVNRDRVQPGNANAQNTAQETATWQKVADRVGKSDCLQNIYTGKVLCQEIDWVDHRLVVDRR